MISSGRFRGVALEGNSNGRVYFVLEKERDNYTHIANSFLIEITISGAMLIRWWS